MMCLRYSNSIFLKSSGNREDYIDIQVLKTNSLCSPRVLRCSQGLHRYHTLVPVIIVLYIQYIKDT